MKSYNYCGSHELLTLVSQLPKGYIIHSTADLMHWVLETEQVPVRCNSFQVVATYIINLTGQLVLADRHSEHVVCAGGQPVLGAGEIVLSYTKKVWSINEITNQSTGYCPDPESWQAVAQALRSLNIDFPATFTHTFIFRKCSQCHTVNIIKDNQFECAVCQLPIP